MDTHCCPTDLRMHVALDTKDLARAIDFYARVFGRPPAKQRTDWAKFELDAPPLVFSLNRVAASQPRGRLSHLGFRLPSHTALDQLRDRFAAAGIAVTEEPGADCCYALQDKIWIEDPDGNPWEFYLLLADTEAPATGRDGTCCVDAVDNASSQACCADAAKKAEGQSCCGG